MVKQYCLGGSLAKEKNRQSQKYETREKEIKFIAKLISDKKVKFHLWVNWGKNLELILF